MTRTRVCGGLGRRRAELLDDLDMDFARRTWSEKGAPGRTGRAIPGPLTVLLLVLVAGGAVDRAEAVGEGRKEGLRHPPNLPPSRTSVETWSDSDGAKEEGLPLLDGVERALMRAVRRADSVTAFYVELTLALTMPVHSRPKSRHFHRLTTQNYHSAPLYKCGKCERFTYFMRGAGSTPGSGLWCFHFLMLYT